MIKFLDDYIDQEFDEISLLLQMFGKAGMAYALIGLLIAAKLNFSLTFVLFSASYVIGMFDSLSMKLPSGLPSWLEGVLAIIVSVIFTGFSLTFWALATMGAIQLIDDILDYKEDYQNHVTTSVTSLGLERSAILFLITLYLSLMLYPVLSVSVFVIALVISEGFCKTLLARRDNNFFLNHN